MTRKVAIVTDTLLHSSMPDHVITAASCSLFITGDQHWQVKSLRSTLASQVVAINTARPVVVPRHVAITTLLRSSRSGPLMEPSSLQALGAGIRFVWWST